ncbi:MAG: septum formation initiator family protein [Acidobacteria bacterium]|nr:septum formation initiator family protein [Acidobacteriota bacterium]
MDFRVVFPKIRVRSTTTVKLQLLARHAEHFEARTNRIWRRIEPFFRQLFRLRTRLATVGVALVAVWLFVHVVFGANGMVVYRSKRAEYQRLEREIDQLKNENEDGSRQVNQLKTDPRRIEREAREQFHYARPGELIYVAPEAPAAAPPKNRSVAK